MSWIHSFSQEDFTSYALSTAQIVLISYSVDGLDETLKESFDAGIYVKTPFGPKTGPAVEKGPKLLQAYSL